ncbi:MAG: dickkopf-related protein [Nanoarchaeota archaeon]
MKKLVLIILILSFINLISSATIEMKSSYLQGETIIAKVSGNFYDTIQESNIYFYRGHVKIPMDYDVAKIGDFYYIKASLLGKTESNYSLSIKNVRHYEAGLLKTDDITKNFTVTNQIADFSLSKGFVISSNNFSIDVQNLKDLTLSLNVQNPSKLKSSSPVSVLSNVVKAINFDVSEMNGTVEDAIKISSSSLSYEIPVLITHFIQTTPEPVQEYCGDGIVNGNETCDGSDIGSFEGCSDFGFNSGSLSCNSPGSSYECKIDNSNCYNASSVACEKDLDCGVGKVCINNNCATIPQNASVCGNGVREGYEQCDKKDWGQVDNCSFFNYDSGDLSCVSCIFDISKCFNKIPTGCTSDSQCKAGEECENGKCAEIYGKECSFSFQCESDEKCKSGFCLEENECRSIKDCDDDEECDDWECVRKPECNDDFDCKYGESCLSGNCIKKDCLSDRDCGSGKECINDVCKIKTGDDCTKDSQCLSSQICANKNCVPKGNSSANQNQIRLCAELDGVFCSLNQNCDGSSRDISGSTCCLGGLSSCKAKPSSSSGKYLGWGLLIAIVLFLIWFFMTKMRKTKPRQLPF